MKPRLLIILLLVTIFLFLLAATTHQRGSQGLQLVSLDKDWEYSWCGKKGNPTGNWLPYGHFSSLMFKRTERDCVWFRRRLPDIQMVRPYLFLGNCFTDINVFLDNNLIFSSPGMPSAHSYLDIFVPPILLNGNAFGKMLFLRVCSRYSMIGIENMPLLGSYESLSKKMISRELPILVLGVIFMSLGLGSILFYQWGIRNSNFFSFGLFSLLVSMYTLSALDSPGFFFSIQTMCINYVSFLLIPIPLLYFMFNLFSYDLKSVFQCCIFIHILLSLLGLIIILFPFGPSYFWPIFNFVTSIVRVLYVVDSVIILLLLVIGSVRKFQYARVILYGFVPMILLSFHEVLRNFGVIRSSLALYPYGMFAFTSSLFAVIIHSSVALHRDVVQLTKERLRLLRELHDGLGRHLTNIKMLADMALYQKDQQTKLTESIRDISEISNDAIRELRNYMNSLEAQKATWQSLIDYLRIEGRRLLLKYDVELHLTSDIQASPERSPTSLEWLHITRIFFEALENALKHSDCNKIDIQIDLDQKFFKIIISDNGTVSPVEFKPGRGISGMKARASELGGELVIDTERGYVLRLEVPIAS